MVIFDYTHTFTLQQLDVILTQYLELGPYFECLKHVLTSYTTRFESIPLVERHNPDKEHPIRLPLNYYKYKSRQSGEIDKETYEGEVQFVYPLTTVIQILNSNEFYQKLPKNIIINGLLTTTNISIVIETLRIISDQLSKLIKNTLASIEEKQLTNYINTLVEDCLEERESGDLATDGESGSQKRMSLKDLGFLGLLFEKGLNMMKDESVGVVDGQKMDSVVKITGIESEPRIESIAQLNDKFKANFQRKPSKRSSIIASLLSASDINREDTKKVVKTLKQLIIDEKAFKPLGLIDKQSDEEGKDPFQEQFAKKPKLFTECEYCRNMRNYLLESTGLSYFDLHEISRIPTQVYNILKRIKSVTNVFTLYLRETNRTTIPADINVVNKVLSNMNIVITQSLWEDEKLNPKILEKNSSKKSSSNSSNSLNNQKSTPKAHTLLNQLQPYFRQVYNYQAHSSNEYTINQLLRVCLKAPGLKEIEKQLVEKYMNEARVKKQGKDIETYFITKQKLHGQTTQQRDGNYDPTPDLPIVQLSSSSQPVVNQLQLHKEYEKQQQVINRALINSKPLYSQINQTYQEEVNINSEIKRHKMFFSNKASRHMDKSATIGGANGLSMCKKNNSVNANETVENERFKMLIYQQYMRNQGFNVTKNNMSAIINQNVSKAAKSMNFIACNNLPRDNSQFIENSLQFFGTNESNFPQQFPSSNPKNHSNNTLSTVHLRTEEQPTENNHYDKKQTEIYNKMLLNGETIRNEVLNDVEYGEAVIYDSLDDFMKKLSEIAAEDEEEEGEEDDGGEDEKNENLFLTMCGGPMLRKTMSGKKMTPKNYQSVRNSKRFHGQGLTKSQSTKIQKKYSLISLENSKELRHTNNTNKQKRNELEETATFSKDSRVVKKQIKFKNQSQNQSSQNFQEWNDNFELKKPAWLDQYIDKAMQKQKQQRIMPVNKNGKTLLENQRFLAFQEKNFLQQCLDAARPQTANPKASKSHINIITSLVTTSTDLKMNKSSTNITRPLSGAPQNPSKSKNGTIKSLSRTLSGKRRSYLLSKEFVIENNSLLTKIYKENIGENVYGNAKQRVEEEKVFDAFIMNIERSKFRADKLIQR